MRRVLTTLVVGIGLLIAMQGVGAAAVVDSATTDDAELGTTVDIDVLEVTTDCQNCLDPGEGIGGDGDDDNDGPY